MRLKKYAKDCRIGKKANKLKCKFVFNGRTPQPVAEYFPKAKWQYKYTCVTEALKWNLFIYLFIYLFKIIIDWNSVAGTENIKCSQ